MAAIFGSVELDLRQAKIKDEVGVSMVSAIFNRCAVTGASQFSLVIVVLL